MALELLGYMEPPYERLDLAVQQTTEPTSDRRPWATIGARQWIFAVKPTTSAPRPEPRTMQEPPLRF